MIPEILHVSIDNPANVPSSRRLSHRTLAPGIKLASNIVFAKAPSCSGGGLKLRQNGVQAVDDKSKIEERKKRKEISESEANQKRSLD